jgi:hypothetical protein
MEISDDKIKELRQRLFNLRVTYAPQADKSVPAVIIRELCSIVESVLPELKTQTVTRYLVTFTNKAVPAPGEPPCVMIRGSFNTVEEAEEEAADQGARKDVLCVNVVAFQCEVPLYE